MNRHVALVGALTALSLLLPATAAHAEVAVQETSPAAGQAAKTTGPVPLEVRTTYESIFECPTSVSLQVTDVEGEPRYETVVSLELVPQEEDQHECQIDGGERFWAGASLDPVTLGPFADGGPVCNGHYHLTTTVRRDGEVQMSETRPFSLRLPPSAPADVTVTTGVERATVEWSPAPEPDVTGYRILRGDRDDPDWETVVGPDVTTVEDADAPAGKHEYRVASLRADGLVDGKPAKPCTDDGQDLQTTSAAVPATVDAPATESETPSESESATESETATETESETATPTPTPEDEPEPEPEPVPVETTDPEPTEVESTDPDYDEQLDFSGVGPSSPDDDPDGGAVALDVPGGRSGMDQLLGPILRPIAGGMILLVFALHLRRWSRDVW